ncbi:YciI family protein [Pelagibacterium luteolum]|uniref:Uncharacterized conserved protein n=1 Tax=Pelagibacterium luteolum TaxID=440168 RepID=A0A1G7YAN1_9HYPH|nr:YciI family protein [Pelagibacterium luteolum]SDG93389.1 Uncharacterized conserved protein [Pelagibacterium luteolum]
MRYMMLYYLDESKFAVMEPKKREGYINQMLDFDDELRASGHFVMAEALKQPGEAVTVRRWDGVSTTDGPFMETKEHLSGFCLIEARDLNEALAIAARVPLADTGSIEVRPLEVLERIEE